MIDPLVQDILRAANWARVCSTTVWHGSQMAARCYPDFQRLIADVTTRFTNQSVPSSDAELSRRQLQAAKVSQMVTKVCEASRKTITHPHLSLTVYQATKKFCDEDWPGTDEQMDAIGTKTAAFSIFLMGLGQ